MALFGSKKKTDAAPEAVKAEEKKPRAKKAAKTEIVAATPTVASTEATGFSDVLRRPRITEKASMKAEQNVYAFEVAVTATKHTIAKAVRALYNVTPRKVSIVTIPKKNVIVRGKKGVKGGGKKAYVYLNKGETIEFV